MIACKYARMIAALPLLPNLLPSLDLPLPGGDADGFADLFMTDLPWPLPETGSVAPQPAPLPPIMLPPFDGAEGGIPAETSGLPPALSGNAKGDDAALPDVEMPLPDPCAPDMPPPDAALPDIPAPASSPTPAKTTPAADTPPLAAPEPPADPVAHKVLERLSGLTAQDDLGPLQVVVEREGDQIRIVLMAERADTLDLMRRHADQLLADLSREGLANATCTFIHPPRAEEAAPSPDATHIDITAYRSASGLDLRL